MNPFVNSPFTDFVSVFASQTKHPTVMLLTLFVDGDADLKAKYVDYAQTHNKKLIDECHFYDSGFDLFLPTHTSFSSAGVNKVDYHVRCSAQIVKCCTTTIVNPQLNETTVSCDEDRYYTGYYMYPRSSLSKTNVRLANCTGIVDAGYRGHLIGMFDCNSVGYQAEKYDRLLQICAPNLMPICVNVVDTIEELGPNTSRGDGAFGSSGR